MEVNPIRNMERNSSTTDFNANTSTAPRADNTNRNAARGVVQANRVNTESASAPIITAESLRNDLAQLQETLSTEFFDRFIQEANTRLMPTNRRFNYDFHEATSRIIVRIVDSETDEVIREIPPDKILNIAEKMLDLVGVIFDEKV